MSRIVTYANTPEQCFCQIQLDSGERILISIAQTGIAIFELDSTGLVPTSTLFEWGIEDIGVAIRLFADFDDPQKPPLDAMRDALIRCPSIAAISDLCTS